MPTNIAVIRNDSSRSVVAYNTENPASAFCVGPGVQQPPIVNGPGIWITWHVDKPLVVATQKGVCRIWDDNWQLHARWEGTPGQFVLLAGQGNGVGGNVRLNVAASGDIGFLKI